LVFTADDGSSARDQLCRSHGQDTISASQRNPWPLGQRPRSAPLSALVPLTQDNLAPYADKIWAFDINRSSGEITARFGGRTARFGFGQSFLGTPLRNLHEPHVFQVSQAIFTRVVSQPACCRWSGKLFKADDGVVKGERIMRQVGSNQENADGLLGATDFDCPVPRTPRNLEIIHDIADWCGL